MLKLRGSLSALPPINNLHRVMSPVELHEVAVTTFVAKPKHLLVSVNGEAPGFGVGHVEDVQLSVTEPDEL